MYGVFFMGLYGIPCVHILYNIHKHSQIVGACCFQSRGRSVLIVIYLVANYNNGETVY